MVRFFANRMLSGVVGVEEGMVIFVLFRREDQITVFSYIREAGGENSVGGKYLSGKGLERFLGEKRVERSWIRAKVV